MLAISESSGALATTAGKEGAMVLGDELALVPHTGLILLAEVGNDALVELKLGLKVAEKGVGVVLALADKDHDAQVATELEP